MGFPSWAIALVCLGGYVIGSYALHQVLPWRYRKEAILLNLRQRFAFKASNIAHRGGSIIGPENTLFAFDRAISEGHADMLEMDVHLSSDGQVIVVHDEKLARIVDPDGPDATRAVQDIIVSNHPLNDVLPQLARKIALHFPSRTHGEHYNYCEPVISADVGVDPSTTRLCLLEEVFQRYDGVPIHLDMKAISPNLVDLVLRMILKFHRESYTIIGSSESANTNSMYEWLDTPQPIPLSRFHTDLEESNAPPNTAPTERFRDRFLTFGNTRDFLVVYLCFYLGILPLVPLRFDVFSIPIFTKERQRQLSRSSCISSVTAAVMPWFLNAPLLWRHLARRGILVLGWVQNDPEEFVEASQHPISGMMTDDPIALHTFYATHAESIAAGPMLLL